MAKISLLDCTLRDGGYINDWDFGNYTIKDIIRKLVESGVDYAEIGFLRDCVYDENKTLFNNCAEISKVLPANKGKTRFTAMALHNKYSVDKLEPYDGGTIDAIRVTFHDYDIDEGLKYIQKVMDKGYKVFANPINIMGYSDAMILELLQKINQIKPYAFSIVDTFGSMMKEDLQRIYSLIEHNLSKDIVIGLHLHENLAMSYSLAQDFINMKASDRECVIDASMLGMGRAPGNLCMELIMDYMNKRQSGYYNVNPVLDGIDDHINQLKQIEPWGYNTAYALSAKYNLHRNYAEFLLDKGRLRAKQINQILASIDDHKKTAYDEEYIESLYESYQNHEVDDRELLNRLKCEWKERTVLIMAPGASIMEQEDKVKLFIKAENPVIISANFIPESYKQDYAFFVNAVRYSAIKDKNDIGNLLITSNLVGMGNAENVLNYSDLCFDEKGKCDNSVIMLLKLMMKVGKNQVYVVGFDGYQSGSSNYVSSYMANQHTKGMEENIKNTNCVADIRKQLEVIFLTPSLYDKAER